jgi:hypothetical protein
MIYKTGIILYLPTILIKIEIITGYKKPFISFKPGILESKFVKFEEDSASAFASE